METLGPERNPAVKGQSTYKRTLVRTAAWIVAVPALCALVLIGGAAPVYLLLPDAAAPPAAAPQEAAISPSSAPSAGAPQAQVRTAAVSEPAPVEREPVAGSGDAGGTEVADEAPPVEPLDGDEPIKAETAIVPTPRPTLMATDLAAIGAALPKPQQPAGPAVERREASLSRPERRSFTIRPTAVRSAPGGREIGMLGRGAEVLVGRCDDWCEVSASGLKGWLHPSFLREAAGRPAPDVRSDDRRQVDRRDRSWADGDDRWDARPVRRYRDGEAAGDEQFIGRERWRAEDREPVEFYGYE